MWTKRGSCSDPRERLLTVQSRTAPHHLDASRAAQEQHVGLIEKQRDPIRALCQQYGVRRVDLFGSAQIESVRNRVIHGFDTVDDGTVCRHESS